jgi:hypothetical protein
MVQQNLRERYPDSGHSYIRTQFVSEDRAAVQFKCEGEEVN